MGRHLLYSERSRKNKLKKVDKVYKKRNIQKLN